MELTQEDLRVGEGFLEHLPLDNDDASDLDPFWITTLEEVENATHSVGLIVEGNEVNHWYASTR